ncbi:hypothetical protein NLJ89_g1049 [Agrocybe chaxingu]|uniref:Methyltransferase ausD n=1 Tax=Agrocybe chaxingu TaxID=84603 RepID=A0A9W8N0V6_9AGAR|nr:hypothetical protein NLJ89_g1049 [Agrocybe chaxingu]
MPTPAHGDEAIRQTLDPSLYAPLEDELAFFKQQTGIQNDEELKSHVISVQTKAYQVYGYPCIRRFGFMKLNIARLPAYPRALSLLLERADPILLDIGCCFGNDARKAVVDGWPAKYVVASDLRQSFWDYGHELFKSTPESFPATFFAGDAFDDNFLAKTQLPPPSEPRPDLRVITSLNSLRGKISVVHASSFFHIFSEERQLDLACRLASLILSGKGSVILGQHIANPQKGLLGEGTIFPSIFCHSPASWRQLWEEEVFGKEVPVNVDAELVRIGVNGPPILQDRYEVSQCLVHEMSLLFSEMNIVFRSSLQKEPAY